MQKNPNPADRSGDLSNDMLPTGGEASPTVVAADPTMTARLSMQSALPKRFYENAAIEEREEGLVLTLDGRMARTPGRKPLAFPGRALGEAIAQEWQAQVEVINPALMPMTRIANSAIDGVAEQADAVADEIVKYAGSDLVCYRAGEPERLVAAQAQHWDPVLAFARERYGARFLLSEGIVFVEQPQEAIAAIRARVAQESDPFRLAALNVMTTLTGSALVALATADGALDADTAWDVAHVDEMVQESIWGEDADALRRRAVRKIDFDAAVRMAALSS
ncbi:MAG TPA: ATP12 family protein [Saliniramus sp.]|nr:ATP12 family protein [Saliniramus sp.]